MSKHSTGTWPLRWMTAGLLLFMASPLGLGCGGAEGEPLPGPQVPGEVSLSQPLAYNGHDYLFIRSPMNWAQAGAFCDSLGYGLVTINDAREQAFLLTFEGGQGWWMGANDIQTEGTWVWRDGSSSYTNWSSGEPSDSGGAEDCGVDNQVGHPHQWNDFTCSGALYFICESRD